MRILTFLVQLLVTAAFFASLLMYVLILGLATGAL